MNLNSTFRYYYQGIDVQQRSHNVRALIAGCMGYKATIVPFHTCPHIMPAHSAITHSIFHDYINLWAYKMRMPHHLSYHWTTKSFECHGGGNKIAGKPEKR